MTICEHWATNWRNKEEVGVTAFYPDKPVAIRQATRESHENFDEILDGLKNERDVYDLFDPQEALNREFRQVTDRVSLSGGRVHFDLVPVHDAVAEHIIRHMREDKEFDPEPLAKFMERLAANPSEHSREHLFKWLQSERFTINEDGKIVGYKGVNKSGTDSNGDVKFVSVHSGPAVVDGKPVNGHVPNQPGSVVQMPRDQVTFDPAQACSAGLHVGTWSYAKGFGQVVLEVEVDPADVVSVPSDANGTKMRCWRYKIVQVIDQPYGEAIKPYVPAEDYEEYDYDYDPYDDEDEDDNY